MKTVVIEEEEQTQAPPDATIQQAQEYGEMRAEFRQLQQQLQEALAMLQTAQNTKSFDQSELAELRTRVSMLEEQKAEIKQELEQMEEENQEDPDLLIVEPPPLPEPQIEEPPQPKRSKIMDWLLS